MNNLLVKIGRGVGGVVGALYQAGRDSVETVIRNILPFMAFISFIIGLVLVTGVGDFIANGIKGLAGSLVGLLIVSIVCAIPLLSPLLGPGAVIAQIVGTLPALFAINPQVGCDFIPVGLALGEAEPETVEIGVPAVLFSRLITGPLAVVIAYFASFGMYQS
jgi:sorbitol-specific phosphotransferase system component IIBC